MWEPRKFQWSVGTMGCSNFQTRESWRNSSDNKARRTKQHVSWIRGVVFTGSPFGVGPRADTMAADRSSLCAMWGHSPRWPEIPKDRDGIDPWPPVVHLRLLMQKMMVSSNHLSRSHRKGCFLRNMVKHGAWQQRGFNEKSDLGISLIEVGLLLITNGMSLQPVVSIPFWEKNKHPRGYPDRM